MSNSAQHRLLIVPETTYGTTPTTPAVKAKGITGTSLALTKGKIESATIRPDRQVTDVRHGNRNVGGDISVELNFGGFDDMLEALFCGTWVDNELVPGITRRSFSVLRHFTDLASGAYPFHLFKGVEFNTLALSIAPEKLVEATFGCVGRELILGTAAPTGMTVTEASTNKPFDTFTGSLTVDGATVANVTEISLSLENGIESRFVVFNDKTNPTKIGKTRVTGTLTTYFSDASLLVAFNGAANKSLGFELTDQNGNTYTFDLPQILPMSGATDVKGEDDITVPIQFAASVDEDSYALKVTRLEA